MDNIIYMSDYCHRQFLKHDAAANRFLEAAQLATDRGDMNAWNRLVLNAKAEYDKGSKFRTMSRRFSPRKTIFAQRYDAPKLHPNLFPTYVIMPVMDNVITWDNVTIIIQHKGENSNAWN